MTRARGLHATRSSIPSDNDTSSLPGRRIACRFFLLGWHRAHTCHSLNARTATSADRWHGSQACTFCAPCDGHMGASGEPLGAAATRRFGRGVRTCAFGPESSYVNRALFGIYRPPPTDGLVPRRVWRVGPARSTVTTTSIMGTWARLGSRWARRPHAGLAGECTLCAFLLCISCFIRDTDR